MSGDILFARVGGIGRVTLNRPQALNALTAAMCRDLAAQLDEWARDDAVTLVVIDGAGERAFCAGGDIRALYADWQAGGTERFGFYRDEYRLNACIERFPKPYVALIDGIAMGGGVGVSIHGSHRVASERTLLAMPETGIGLFPDVGTTYVLPRLPGQLGLFLGLTGHRLKAADCQFAGLVDAVVPASRHGELVDALAAASDPGAVSEIVRRLAVAPEPAPFAGLRAEIDATFGFDSVAEILQALEARDTPFGRETAAILRKKSPTSLAVTLRQLRLGATLDFAACMRLEYRLACHFMRGHDFFEGVRAVVIDKDNRPAWRPATLDAVTGEVVDGYFAPAPEGELTFGRE